MSTHHNAKLTIKGSTEAHATCLLCKNYDKFFHGLPKSALKYRQRDAGSRAMTGVTIHIQRVHKVFAEIDYSYE